MRLRLYGSLFWLLLICLLFQPGCATTDEADTTQYSLTVILSEGVTGEPVAGTYNYDQGETVSYNFILAEGYGNLTVTLDDVDVPAGGTVTMNADHLLTARAGGCAIDIRGKWKGIMVWPFMNPYHIYDLYFDMEFFGDLLSGHLEGNLDLFPMKEKGTYAVEGCDVRMEMGINLYVANYRGPATGQLIMRGTAENSDRFTGTWEMKNVNFNFQITYSVAWVVIPQYSGTFWLERE